MYNLIPKQTLHLTWTYFYIFEIVPVPLISVTKKQYFKQLYNYKCTKSNIINIIQLQNYRNIQLQLINKLFLKSLFINTTKDCKVPYIELIMIKTLQFYITTFPKYSIISLPKRNHILFNQVINAQIKKSNTQVKLNITKVREIIIQQNVQDLYKIYNYDKIHLYFRFPIRFQKTPYIQELRQATIS
eukprot:TRINITY_DN63_c0_g1_i10.p1 TRINITY_DN63_c0_g1~~TRINITY_DN63_c0_g1_i10.p1  ORF type:complete len:187 (+),score=-30.36 TRINITY_DN63_c0_g1_i10:139-699(+)